MKTAILLRPESSNEDFPEFTFFVAKDYEEFNVLAKDLHKKVTWITSNEDHLDDTPLTLEGLLVLLGYDSVEQFKNATVEQFIYNCLKESTPVKISSLMI
jgi:hypothetical protein